MLSYLLGTCERACARVWFARGCGGRSDTTRLGKGPKKAPLKSGKRFSVPGHSAGRSDRSKRQAPQFRADPCVVCPFVVRVCTIERFWRTELRRCDPPTVVGVVAKAATGITVGIMVNKEGAKENEDTKIVRARKCLKMKLENLTRIYFYTFILQQNWVSISTTRILAATTTTESPASAPR